MKEKTVKLITEKDLRQKFSHLDIVFEVYESVWNGDLDQVTDMTQEIPVKGKAVFVYNLSSSGKRQYQSEVVQDATYAQIAEFADVARKANGDSDHRYFEGVDVLYHVEGISIVELSLGS